MNVLVVNCGSSSVKMELIDTSTEKRIDALTVERILDDAIATYADKTTIDCKGESYEAVLTKAFISFVAKNEKSEIRGVGHRVAHGGAFFDEAVVIDQNVKEKIESLIPLAPLHNPINLKGIEVAQKIFADLIHVAVFDTAFHQTMPKRSQVYAIDKNITEKYNIRRYGFHGTSHEFVAKKTADFLEQDFRDLRIITGHLGNGCSMAAIEYGRSIETSMGMTPLEGLVMGTRSGDIDPGILIYLMQQEGWSPKELDHFLNKESGLKGLSGVGSDMRDIIKRSSEQDADAQMALNVFCHQVRKYIGAYATVLGGVDAIIFTGGIGENSMVVRHRICQRLDFLGAQMNEDANRCNEWNDQNILEFSTRHSRVKLFAVKTDEQLSIAKQSIKIILEKNKVNGELRIPIAVSARHVHLTQETVEALFGKGYQLTEKKPLSQPGQFAANERVTVVGPKNSIERVRILGPTRSKNQVEISRTDEYYLGIDAPVRQSGNTENSPGCTLIGPEGEVHLKDGVICAWRHIHMTPEDAILLDVEDRDIVEVEVSTDERSLTFGNVMVRVNPNYKLEMHIDTDEGNAAEISNGQEGSLLVTGKTAHLKKKKV